MSAVTTKNIRNRYSVEKTNNKKGGGKFCKICKDTGKSHDEYTNHYVRETPDPNSKVVCPTLISAVCRYCKEGGHTVKHCPKIQAKNRQLDNASNTQSHIISKKYCISTNEKKKTINKDTVKCSAFSVLDDYVTSDEEEEANEEVIIDNVDDNTTPSSPQSDNTVDVNSYANILKNGPPPPVQKVIAEQTTAMQQSQVNSLIPTKLDFSEEIYETKSDKKVEKVVTLFDISGNWADADDDDEDDASTLALNFVTSRPVFSNKTNPLHYYNNKLIEIVSKYTDGYTKQIRITEDAFHELFSKWDKEFFTDNDASGRIKRTMNINPATQSSTRKLAVMNLFTN